MKKRPAFRIKGIRRRWLINTVGIVSALGLVCVLAVTAAFAAYHYGEMEADMRECAKTATDTLLEDYAESSNAFYVACIHYAESFDDIDGIVLQFVNAQGKLIASSAGEKSGVTFATEDVRNAVDNRLTDKFVGADPQTGERIMAISAPLVYSNGEVIGALRYVTATSVMDRQIAQIAGVSFLALLIVLLVILISNNYYIRSILLPLEDIIDKTQKITNGSYGIQIQKKYDDEIGQLAETINEISLKISQNEKMQTDFISSLSHELRTPLTALTGWSETLLSSDDLTPDTRRGMKIIHREAGRLTEMVLDLLDFTRIQDGRMVLNIEVADIRAEFEDTIFMYGNRLSQEDIKLEYVENDDDIPEVSCDPKRLRQVFLNILDNAAKHGSAGKRIDASICKNGDDVVVTIRDYGPGIPEDELPLVKKKFYKGSSTARGSGIGLAVCDEIVQLHGGALNLENAPDGGTVVTVVLPISQ